MLQPGVEPRSACTEQVSDAQLQALKTNMLSQIIVVYMVPWRVCPWSARALTLATPTEVIEEAGEELLMV